MNAKLELILDADVEDGSLIHSTASNTLQIPHYLAIISVPPQPLFLPALDYNMFMLGLHGFSDFINEVILYLVFRDLTFFLITC